MFVKLVLFFSAVSLQLFSVESFFGLNIDLLIGNEIYQECSNVLLKVNDVSYSAYQLSLIGSQDARVDSSRSGALKLSGEVLQLVSPFFQNLNTFVLDRRTNATVMVETLDGVFNTTYNYLDSLMKDENSSFSQMKQLVQSDYSNILKENLSNFTAELLNIQNAYRTIGEDVMKVQENSEFEMTYSNVIGAFDIANINSFISSIKREQITLQNIRKVFEDINGMSRTHAYIYDAIENAIRSRSSAVNIRSSYLESTVNSTRAYLNATVMASFNRVNYSLGIFLQQLGNVYSDFGLENDLLDNVTTFVNENLPRLFAFEMFDRKIGDFGSHLMSSYSNDINSLIFSVQKQRETVLRTLQSKNVTVGSLNCYQTYLSRLVSAFSEGTQQLLNCIEAEIQNFGNNFASINGIYDKSQNEISVVTNNLRSCLLVNNDGSDLSKNLIKSCLIAVSFNLSHFTKEIL